jgi:hypothetical protein
VAGLLSDTRRTALGAVGLLLVALMFAEPGGLGGHAVKAEAEAETPADGPPPAALRATANEKSARWLNSAGEEDEPKFAPTTPRAIVPVPEGPVEAAPGPIGPDFPPGLQPPQ